MAGYTNIPATSSGGGNTVLARAQSLLPSGNITKVMGTDFDNDQWYRTSAIGGGTATLSTTDKGGVLNLVAPGVANQGIFIAPHGTVVLLDNMSTSKWYYVWRIIATSAVDANAQIVGAFFTTALANPSIKFGINGSVSAAFFSWLVIDNGGATTASGATTVAIDTAYHVFEMWSDGTTITFAMDGAIAGTTAASNAGTNPVTPWIGCYNGATAAIRTAKADYMYLCTGEAQS